MWETGGRWRSVFALSVEGENRCALSLRLKGSNLAGDDGVIETLITVTFPYYMYMYSRQLSRQSSQRGAHNHKRSAASRDQQITAHTGLGCYRARLSESPAWGSQGLGNLLAACRPLVPRRRRAHWRPWSWSPWLWSLSSHSPECSA